MEIKKLDLDLTYEKLDNGLEIYVIPKLNSNMVYATFSTKYGSNAIEFIPIDKKEMQEVPLGIAHFLEHKLFEQSNGIDPFTFYSQRGADANANTNQTKTTYLFSGASFTLENLNYLLDYVQQPYFTDKNVLKEKGIITQEIKMYQDDPDTVLYESLLGNCFINNPMKYPIIGNIESINAITKEDLYTCYNTFYHPSNMFVVVTGNVDAKEIIEAIKVNQANKKITKAKEIKIKQYDEPNKVAIKEAQINLNVSLPKCSVAYKVKITQPNNLYKNLLYLLTLFDAKIGPTSLFVKNLIDDKIINNNLGIDFDNTDDYIIIFVVGEANNPDVLLKSIIKEMTCLKITKEDFERKKKTLISSLIYMSDNIFSLNHSVMNDIIKYKKFNVNRYEDIKSLNYDDFIKLIKKLDLSNYSTFTVNPK
ncbi:MAG: pitrilysin family protein [Bacilli bacterium]